ncbi:kunitz-type serine protease inhibitor bitisilin-3-like [Zootoca vivipara]|uniref:kunitz-type serine protease inhibitor bitisilin-3-like n=1 Tax=Zootoca vivipara TaxID=8524 RepID=UPI00293BFAA3|nr:kunitz-type serine protease inhibitor bitisilin-3-like [Zootoca vivipara]
MHLHRYGTSVLSSPSLSFSFQTGKNFHLANRLAAPDADYLADAQETEQRSLVPEGRAEQGLFGEVQNRTNAGVLLRESAPPLADPCALPMDEGSCLQYTVLWYYHQAADKCRPFIFGGCGGNANQFPSKWKCELWCKKTTG